MQRRVGWVIAVVAVLLFLFWLFHSRSSTPSVDATATTSHRTDAAATAAHARVDPRAIPRASIRGTVRDDAGAPIAKARVCAAISSWFLPSEITDLAICATTDAQGQYRLSDLLAADYEVSAGARTYHPASYEADPQLHRRAFPLKAGETRTIDLVLRPGGVEVSGKVLDISGGPIAHAQVSAARGGETLHGPMVETDAQGAFSLWVDRGPLQITARADGYAPGKAWLEAPDTRDIILTPESSLAGQVLDAETRQPIENARVMARIGDLAAQRAGVDITDAQGRFRIEHLEPGRYQLRATTEHRYGVSDGSTLVGLGQHVEGVIVLVYPAHQIIGQVLVAETKQPTDDCMVILEDPRRDQAFRMRSDGAGRQVADGVMAGEYRVALRCDRYHGHDEYPRVVVKDADITNAVWEVDGGATIRGKVLTHAREPVDDAEIFARGGGTGRVLPFWSSSRSHADGSFELTGLLTGSYEIHVRSDRGVEPTKGYTVEVPAGVAQVEHDLVLEAGGALLGHVVDAKGKPVRDVEIELVSVGGMRFAAPSVKSDAKGDFHAEGLRAGAYQVTAMRAGYQTLRKPGTNDDVRQGERVEIRVGEITTTQLIVESDDGAISGVVLDPAGKPVPDAFVSNVRESDAAGAQGSSVGETRDWWGDDKPALTTTEGRFTLENLAPGRYTLRAYRKGGGEAIAEHVATGSTTTLRFKPTASIAGTARTANGTSPTTLKITVRGHATSFLRSDSFYRTAGAFKIEELPAGHYEIVAEGDGSQRSATIDLAEGEARTGLALVLDPRVDVTGRLVERGTERPVPGFYMMAAPSLGGAIVLRYSEDPSAVSDDTGRFTLHDVPAGKLVFRGFAVNYRDSPYAHFAVFRSVAAGTSAVDIGTIEVLRARVKPGDPVGELGIKFVQLGEEVPVEQRERKISWIDPTGPAARTELQVGDVITQCDGVDITGENAPLWDTLSRAAPGTKLALTTKRGPTITITLANP